MVTPTSDNNWINNKIVPFTDKKLDNETFSFKQEPDNYYIQTEQSLNDAIEIQDQTQETQVMSGSNVIAFKTKPQRYGRNFSLNEITSDKEDTPSPKVTVPSVT